ncbi:efflux RND transporter permease subunit [Treponema sp. OMZ 805]|uniref:efflux RND transporter permease subunit n=1 Tax=Treponema sp. OMZ 805 TaxID=2726068 RepID=UPI003D92873E
MKYGKNYAYTVIMVIAAITVLFGFMIPKIDMDNELRHFFPEKHPSNIRFKQLTADFGDQYAMDIVIETKEDTILRSDYVAAVKNISEELALVDNVVKVRSLTNIEFITAKDGSLVVETLLPEPFSGTAAEIQAIKQKIFEWPHAYLGTIISDNFKGVQIVVTLSSICTPSEISALYNNTVEIVKRNLQTLNGMSYKIAGDPVLAEYATLFMYADLRNLIPLITVVVLFCLFLSFKNIEGTILPLLAVLISTVWTIGTMAVLGEPLTIVSSCLPVLLIAVGSAYGIHIVNHYYQHLEMQPLITSQECHCTAVAESLKEIRAPVLLAGITTIAGFISTITSPIKPLKSFATFSAYGIVIELVVAFLLIPALLVLKPIRLVQKQQNRMKVHAVKQNARLAALGIKIDEKGLTHKIYLFFNRHRAGFIIMLLVIISLSIWGIHQLNIESAFLEYFPKNSEIREGVSYIDDHYVGSTGFSLLIDGKKKGALCDPEILKQMDDLSGFLTDNYAEIGTILSFSDFIKRLNQVMHKDMLPESFDAAEAVDENSQSTESFFSDTGSFFTDSDAEQDGGMTDVSSPDNLTAQIVSSTTTEPSSFAARYRGKTLTTDDVMELFIAAYAQSGGKNVTLPDFMTALQKELNYNGAAYDEIPYDISKYPVAHREELKNLISQYLLLYSGSLDDLVDEQLEPSKTRMQIMMRVHDTGKIKAVINAAEQYAQQHFPEGYTLEASGLGELETAMTSMIIDSQVSSLLLAIVIVFCILSLYYRSPIAGLIGAVPLGISILMNFGIMGLAGINLDMVTSLVAAIAIGIGIDYTVHFMNNYHKERLRTDDLTAVTVNTLQLSGKAIMVNAASVGFGFVVLCFSRFVVLRFVGFLVAVVMLTGSVAAMTILPVLLNIFKPRFMAANR